MLNYSSSTINTDLHLQESRISEKDISIP